MLPEQTTWCEHRWDKLDGCHTRTTQQEAVWRHIFRPSLLTLESLATIGFHWLEFLFLGETQERICGLENVTSLRQNWERVGKGWNFGFQLQKIYFHAGGGWKRGVKKEKVEIHPPVYPPSVEADPNDIPCKINFSITFGALVFCSRGQLLLQYKPPPLGLEREKKKKREKLSKSVQPRSNSFHRGSGCY